MITFFNIHYGDAVNNYRYIWDQLDERKYLFTASLELIPLNAQFLLYEPLDEQLIMHMTSPESNSGRYSKMNFYFLNESPHAKLIVNVDYTALSGTPLLNKNIGLMYVEDKWAVYLEDGSDMPSQVKFNLLFSYNQMETIEAEIDSEYRVYPSPARDFIHIYTTEQIENMQIFNAEGKLMGTYKNVPQISVQSYPAGIYTLQFKTKDETVTRRFLKK
jgi:hypothetical protein